MKAGNRSAYALAPALALGVVGATAAAKDVISTDRPDFVESSVTVGKGRFQIETGFAIERDTAAEIKETALTTPTLLRVGIAEAWELRFETDGVTRLKMEDANAGVNATARGYADLSVGVKWHAQDGEGLKPSIGWLLHADLPSGANRFRGRGVRPSLRAALEWELPEAFSLGVMPGVVYDSADDGRRFMAGIFAVTVANRNTPDFSWTLGISAKF